jgi:hypothetical protein
MWYGNYVRHSYQRRDRTAATDRTEAQQEAKNNFLAYVKCGNMYDAIF